MAGRAVDFSFVSQDKLRELLSTYWEEARKACDGEAFVGTLALTRAVLEGLLTWRLKLSPEEAGQEYRRLAGDRRWRSGKASSIEDWTLEQLIDVAVAVKVVGHHSHEAHALREYGNLIHPYRARENSWAPPDQRLAQNALNYASLFVDSVRRHMEPAGVSEGESRPPREIADDMNFSWVIDGRIAGCRGPESDPDLEFLRSAGIRGLVRLAETEKAQVTPQQVHRAGLEDCHEPVCDWTAPTQEQIDRVLKFACQALAADKPVAVSCGAGCGRTGTILACYLVTEGRDADEAIRYLVSVRTVSQEVLRVPGQRDAVIEFERRFRVGEVRL